MSLAAVDTPRLHGEPARPEHVEAYAELFGDPAVAATLWPAHLGGPRTRRQATRLLADDIRHWEQHGFGPWVFVRRCSSEIVGRAGLERTDVGGRYSVEVLYAVASSHWGHGYATEMAGAAVEAAMRLDLPEVVGFTLTTNRASQRVLERVGVHHERDVEHAGLPHWFGRRLFSSHR